MPGIADLLVSGAATIKEVHASPIARPGRAGRVTMTKISAARVRLSLGRSRVPEKVTVTLSAPGSDVAVVEIATFVAVPCACLGVVH
jgi:hypothetical protein